MVSFARGKGKEDAEEDARSRKVTRAGYQQLMASAGNISSLHDEESVEVICSMPYSTREQDRLDRQCYSIEEYFSMEEDTNVLLSQGETIS